MAHDRVARAVADLVDRSHVLRPERLPFAVDDAARAAGALGAAIWLISRDQRSLALLRGYGPPERGGVAGRGGPLPVDGSTAGRAFCDTAVETSADGRTLWVPLLDGAERLGVLELAVDPDDPASPSRRDAATLAGLVAELVVSKGQYTDSFERARRGGPMGVAAEMLWRQLPPLTFATDRFVVTAQLEPWDEVGGDAFDYSVGGDTLRLAVFDGMGHGLGATLLASVALATYRNCRRAGFTLIETARGIDEVLARQFGDESFVTGVLAELDLTTGTLRTLLAAHPAPLLVRDGKAVGELDADPGLPLGLGDRHDTIGEAQLQRGDRILMFSDGVVEARGRDGDFFGTERLVDLLVRQEAWGHSPPETLRRLALAVLEHQQGALQDDATLLMLEWAGDSGSVLPAV